MYELIKTYRLGLVGDWNHQARITTDVRSDGKLQSRLSFGLRHTRQSLCETVVNKYVPVGKNWVLYSFSENSNIVKNWRMHLGNHSPQAPSSQAKVIIFLPKFFWTLVKNPYSFLVHIQLYLYSYNQLLKYKHSAYVIVFSMILSLVSQYLKYISCQTVISI